MAKKISVTIAEEAALRHFAERADRLGWEGKHRTALGHLLLKLEAPKKQRTGLRLADAELALQGCAKYAQFAGGRPEPLEARLKSLNVKQGELEAVGQWVDSQGWLTWVTMDSILRNWNGWLARAAAWYRQRGLIMPVWSVTAGDSPAAAELRPEREEGLP